MLKTQKNSKKQGDVGLGVAIGWFSENGYTVSVPLTDSQDYDLVVEKNDGLKKIQVKTVYCKTEYNVYRANLRIMGGNKSGSSVKKFKKEFVDFVFILTNDKEKYLIPSNVLKTSAVNLGPDKDKYKI